MRPGCRIEEADHGGGDGQRCGGAADADRADVQGPGRGGVAGIVQSDVANAGRLQQVAPGDVVGVEVDRPAGVVGEDPVLLGPERCGMPTLSGLRFTVLLEEVDKRCG